jgi:hypothetical protein
LFCLLPLAAFEALTLALAFHPLSLTLILPCVISYDAPSGQCSCIQNADIAWRALACILRFLHLVMTQDKEFRQLTGGEVAAALAAGMR